MNIKIQNHTMVALNLATMAVCIVLYKFLSEGLQAYGAHTYRSTDFFVTIYSNASLMSLSIILLCLWKKMHSYHSQRILLLILLGALAAFLTFPVRTFGTSVLFLSDIIMNILEPWRQAFVFPQYRAMVEVMQVAIEGVIQVLIYYSVSDYFFIKYVGQLKYFSGIILILFFNFIWYLNYFKTFPARSEATDHQLKLRALIQANLDVFLLAVIAGFAISAQVFDHTYVENIPKYINNKYIAISFMSGGIFLPLIIGHLADKKGIAAIAFKASLLLIVLKFISALGSSFIVVPVLPATFGIFIAGGVSQILPALNVALVGHRFSTLRLFAAWALSTLFIHLGEIMAAQVYDVSFGMYHSFALTQFITGICMLLMLLGVWYIRAFRAKDYY